MSDFKNVVVVGLGFAGNTTAKALAAGLPSNFRVIAVQEYDFAYYPPGSLRAATVPGWENKVTAPIKNIFPKGSRHVVLGGVKVVELRSHSLVLERHVEGFGSEIPFEYAVIATGSTYAFPTRVPVGAKTEAEVWQTLKQFQSEVKGAESILVLGGGATGAEFAAEVAVAYPKKKVTLVHPSERLFAPPDFKPKLGASLAQQLQKKGVQIIYNAKVEASDLKSGAVPKQTFNLSNGKQVEADFVFMGFGWTPNSSLVKTLDPALLNDSNFVRVKPTLQLKSTSASYDHIFAAGDVNDIAEVKQAAFANFQAAVVAANVIALTRGKSPVKEYSAAQPLAIVTSGPSGGAGQLFGFVLGAWPAKMMKSKNLMVPGWFSGYNVPVRA